MFRVVGATPMGAQSERNDGLRPERTKRGELIIKSRLCSGTRNNSERDSNRAGLSAMGSEPSGVVFLMGTRRNTTWKKGPELGA